MEKPNIFVEKLIPLYKKERLAAFYKGQQFTDCTFKINGTEIKAHKLILACSSPVFEKMLFGDMASDVIIIADIKVEGFKQVLEFIYTENINITGVGHAWTLFSIANKYLLEDLILVCLKYIRKNITMDSLVLSYEYAEVYSLQDIKNKCFTDIVDYANGVFCNDYHMRATTLSALLEEGPNGIDTCSLVKHILFWAYVECDIKNLPPTPENIVNVLKVEDILEFIKKCWIMNIKCDDCCDSLVMCQCVEEIYHETLLLLDERLAWTEEWAEELCDPEKFYIPTPKFCKVRKEFKIACRVDLEGTEEYLSSITVNRRMMLFGVLVKTAMNPTGSFGPRYEGSVTVRICVPSSSESICKDTTFKGFMNYDSDLYLSLKEVVTLEPNVVYEINISYKDHSNKGVTPVHCYYMSHKLANKAKDSLVSFYEMSGTLIKGLSFYAA